MAIPYDDIVGIMETLKSSEIKFPSKEISMKQAKLAVIQASIRLNKDFSNADDTPQMTEKEIYLCGLYGYRSYIVQEHQAVTQKAVNFKTINFAVTGLTERAKEYMRIVWWCDGEIEKVVNQIRPSVFGLAQQMKGE